MGGVIMQDLIGQELEVGDFVAFQPLEYKAMSLGKIESFTAKNVWVAYGHNYSNSKLCAGNTLAKLSENAVTMYFLKSEHTKLFG